MANSQTDEVLQFAVDPTTVAAACQQALRAAGGRVKQVSRETGTISGKLDGRGFFAGIFNASDIQIRISRSSSGCELRVQTSCNEGVFGGSGAQKAMAAFLKALGLLLPTTSAPGW